MTPQTRRITRVTIIQTLGWLLLIWLGMHIAIPMATANGSGTWVLTGNLNMPRSAHCAALLQNGGVLVAGGVASTGSDLSNSESYNPATGQWTTTGSMAEPRIHGIATTLQNGEVLVIAGYNNQTFDPATAELYNSSS